MLDTQATLEAVQPYTDNFAYLQHELDVLNERLVLRMQAAHAQIEITVDEQKLFVTQEQVTALLQGQKKGASLNDDDPVYAAYTAATVDLNQRIAASLAAGVYLPLPLLCRYFGLTDFEKHVVLLCLAPELRRPYDMAYAFLQDDIARKKPSVDLALQLYFEQEADQWHHRMLLSQQAPLLRAGLVQMVADPGSPSGASGLAQFLKLDERMLQFLLGQHSVDAQLMPVSKLQFQATDRGPAFPLPSEKLLVEFVDRNFLNTEGQSPAKCAFYLCGQGTEEKAELAGRLAGQLGRPLLRVDLHKILRSATRQQLLKLAFRESLLQQAPLLFENADSALKEADHVLLHELEQLAIEYGWFVMLAGTVAWPPAFRFSGLIFNTIELAPADVTLQTAMWETTLKPFANQEKNAANGFAAHLAQRYRLSLGQIRGTANVLLNQKQLGLINGRLDLHNIAEVCKQQSATKLNELAPRVKAQAQWEDLVLPADTKAQLTEICNQVAFRHKVYQTWGFNTKLRRGRGVSALFAGPPGTGKTLAAEVIASKLQLDLYKIDLSSVVSKYIGETEKNLSQIFAEAKQTDAILFFDEADALFGKRTEVADAHDRYANIETSYLLQKMEEYDGIVVMASNFRDNMDDAFTRRIRFIIDFPFPDAESRELIWRKHIPAGAPTQEDINYPLLAKQVPVAGGNIKNIVVHAAFYAAAKDAQMGMEHMLHGVKREYEKIGKLWDENLLDG